MKSQKFVVFWSGKKSMKQVPYIKSPQPDRSAWNSIELRKANDWSYQLSANEIAEILGALQGIAKDKDVGILSASDFPIPTLRKRISGIRKEVRNGYGFFLIKGLPLEHLSMPDIIRMFLGFGAHFGDPVPQNAKGHLLGHVCDISGNVNDPIRRVYTTRLRQPFHTDSCDLVALLCLQPAMRGGASRVCSARTLFNHIQSTRPDLLRVLICPFHVDRKGEVPPGKDDFYQMPVFNIHRGQVLIMHDRTFIDAAQRHQRVPRLTEIQIEALDYLDEVAARKNISLSMRLQKGDMQICHNHYILHARTPFFDHPESWRRRHLLRLWLSQRDGLSLPRVFEERYGNVRKGERRGGIRIEGQKEIIPVYPE